MSVSPPANLGEPDLQNHIPTTTATTAFSNDGEKSPLTPQTSPMKQFDMRLTNIELELKNITRILLEGRQSFSGNTPQLGIPTFAHSLSKSNNSLATSPRALDKQDSTTTNSETVLVPQHHQTPESMTLLDTPNSIRHRHMNRALSHPCPPAQERQSSMSAAQVLPIPSPAGRIGQVQLRKSFTTATTASSGSITESKRPSDATSPVLPPPSATPDDGEGTLLPESDTSSRVSNPLAAGRRQLAVSFELQPPSNRRHTQNTDASDFQLPSNNHVQVDAVNYGGDELSVDEYRNKQQINPQHLPQTTTATPAPQNTTTTAGAVQKRKSTWGYIPPLFTTKSSAGPITQVHRGSDLDSLVDVHVGEGQNNNNNPKVVKINLDQSLLSLPSLPTEQSHPSRTEELKGSAPLEHHVHRRSKADQQHDNKSMLAFLQNFRSPRSRIGSQSPTASSRHTLFTRFNEEIIEETSSETGRFKRKRKSMSREAFVNQLLSESEKLPFSQRTLSSEHWLAELTDILYIVASTIMMAAVVMCLAMPQKVTESVFLLALDVFISLLTLLFAIAKTRTSTRVTEWEVIDDVKTLQSTYLKSRWFAVDLATIVPVEFIFISWAPPMVFSVCLLRHMLRLPRMLTLYRSSHPLLQERQWFSILFIIAISVLVVEFAAQIFRLTESPDDLSGLDASDGTATLSTSHMNALYWTITTITSVGYGDLVPTTEGSKVLAMFVQLFGIAMVAGTTSVATQRLTSSDPVKTDIERRKRMMYSMLSFYDVPWGVQKEVIAQFPSLLAEHNEGQFQQLASNLPQGVGKKIEIFVRRKMVANVPLFKDLQDPSLLLEIATLLTSVIYQPQEYVFHAGEVGSEMYFIASGGVDVLVPLSEELETVVAVLRTGQWFGEIALLLDTRRTASVQAVEASELLVLSKDALLEVACRNESLRQTLDEEVAERLAELNQEMSQRDRFTGACVDVTQSRGDLLVQIPEMTGCCEKDVSGSVFFGGCESEDFVKTRSGSVSPNATESSAVKGGNVVDVDQLEGVPEERSVTRAGRHGSDVESSFCDILAPEVEA